jgi:beta-lactamase superfamily II metal-dependent hydrolase
MYLRSLPLVWYLVALGVLTAANLLIYRNLSMSPASAIQAFALGSSTATLIREPGRALLIDTGPDASILRALGRSLPPWERSLDAVILTSDKAAQSGGIASLTERYQIGTILRAGTADLPYGSTLTFGVATLTLTAPGSYTTCVNQVCTSIR